MGRVHMPANGGFYFPNWFRRDTALARERLASGEITQAEHDEEIEFLNRELSFQNAEFRAGRG